MALLAVAALVGGCGSSDGSDSAAKTTTTPTTTAPTPAKPALDGAGGNACYSLITFVKEADTLTADETHSGVKHIWDGGSLTGAKDSSNRAIRTAARAMLVAEVSGDWTTFGKHANRFADECLRLPPS